MMDYRIEIARVGGPDMMLRVDHALPAPGPGQVLMRNRAIGLNYIDTYHRSGLYPLPLPSGLGVEAAGVVEAVGPGVTEFRPGDRVCTFGPELGAYSSARVLPVSSLLALPDDISDELAAAAMLKGCTAEALVERCARVKAGDTVLVHAAAGGVGLLLVQWLRHIGALVIGTVSTPAKASVALAAGANWVIDYSTEDTAARVRALTDGRGVDVVFDGVGQATWAASVAACARRGLIVSYGNASGPVTGLALSALAAAGSLFVTRPTVFDYYREPAERTAGVARVFAMLAQQAITVTIGQRHALTDVAAAHRELEGRETIGSTILTP